MKNIEIPFNNLERIDTLLALGITFIANNDSKTKDKELINWFSSLPNINIKELEERYRWYENLTAESQEQWITYTLRQARESSRQKSFHIDKTVHPSHIARALLKEPRPIQALILLNLSPVLAESVIAFINAAEFEENREDVDSSLLQSYNASKSLKEFPKEEVLAVIRHSFIGQFIGSSSIRNPTSFDLLSSSDLTRFIRILSIRETAMACRAIPTVESVASFLRRFSTEDAHAIAKHIAALTTVDIKRVAFAEEILHMAIKADPGSKALLNQVGLSILKIVLRNIDLLKLAYTRQKLPIGVLETLDTIELGELDQEMFPQIDKEAETLASTLRQQKD
jgi:hypothetical protein